MLIPPEDRPKALASQSVPENACCNCCVLAFLKVESEPLSLATNTIGDAPTSTTVKAGMLVPLMGSLPLILKARTLAVGAGGVATLDSGADVGAGALPARRTNAGGID